MRMSSKNRKICKRIWLGVTFDLLSPLCISNGEEINTDRDVICDREGNPFIPGTSLAGAVREYLSMGREQKCMFGYSRREEGGTDGRMSSVCFSDTVLSNAKICFRDGVHLNGKASINNKFDWEVVDTGAAGCFYIELVIREGDPEEEELELIRTAFQGMQTGALRLGYRKNRGFGRIHLLHVYQWEFTDKNVSDWLDFSRPVLKREKDSWSLGAESEKFRTEAGAWLRQAREMDKYVSITVPVRLGGGVSIRQYSTRSGEADFEHITGNGQPVVPGTSWNGAIRGRCMEILEDLGISHACAVRSLNQWFGSPETNQSSIVLEESVIENAGMLQISRSKVNRFDASAVSGALYTEIACFGGSTALVIHIAKRETEWKAAAGLLLLAIEDIRNGFLAIGGQTAVGRGLFLENGVVQIQGGVLEELEGGIAEWIAEKIG